MEIAPVSRTPAVWPDRLDLMAYRVNPFLLRQRSSNGRFS